MQVAKPIENPWLAAAVGRIQERGEPDFPLPGITRQRRAHEFELRLAIRVLYALVLLVEDLGRVGAVADRELLREADVIGFRQRQPGDVFFLATRGSATRAWVWSADVAQRREPDRLQAGRLGHVNAVSENAFEARRVAVLAAGVE